MSGELVALTPELWEPLYVPIGSRGAEVRVYAYCCVVEDYDGRNVILDWEELRALLKTLVVHATPQLSITKDITHG